MISMKTLILIHFNKDLLLLLKIYKFKADFTEQKWKDKMPAPLVL